MAFTSQGISFDRETEQSEHLNGICIDDLRDLDKMPDKEEVEEWVKLLKGSTSGMKGANGSNEEEAQTTSVAAEALKKAKLRRKLKPEFIGKKPTTTPRKHTLKRPNILSKKANELSVLCDVENKVTRELELKVLLGKILNGETLNMILKKK
ncbi:hypothetical protein QJS10_CPB20g00804 [Acorus calamus]|uniref:Uncharacterized protein n=1 Tax=Acorus calamus TaxID=4465 RepID=A0AAV9CD12_ACOCL|nr:hypothetical protein QJS10_CPB20g00804 [Acorus calamus]